MILCPRITLGIYQTFNWAMVSHGLEHITSQVVRVVHKGWLKVDKDQPLHLKTFIYISISSYNQLGRIQHHITAACAVDITSQCIHNAFTSDTSDTGNTTSVEIKK